MSFMEALDTVLVLGVEIGLGAEVAEGVGWIVGVGLGVGVGVGAGVVVGVTAEGGDVDVDEVVEGGGRELFSFFTLSFFS